MTRKIYTSFLSAVLLLVTVALNAQVYTGSTVNTAGNSLVPSTGTGGCTVAPQNTGGTAFQVNVTGVTAGNVLGLVRLNMTHTWDSDLNFWLENPTGGRIELSTANGGSGDNFTNTVFCDNAPASITTGTAPFTGNFRPEGGLYTYTCGVATTFNVNTLAGMGSADGFWTLRFMDSAGGDIGTMLGWSLEFGPNCTFVQPQPLAPISLAANNPAICGAQNVPVTAPTLSCPAGGGATMSVFLNGVLINPSVPSGGTFTVSGPAGSHVLRYVLPNCQERTQALTITDGAPPIITCPSSVTLNLGPGACSTYYDYSVLFSDNCPLTLNGTVNHPIDFNNGQAGVMFDIRNTGGAPINIVNFTPSLDPGTWPMQIYITTTAATWVGNDVNPGAWTLLTQQNITSVGTTPGTLIPVTGLTLQPGQAKGVYITSTTGFPINYTNGARTFSDANLTVGASPGAGKAFPFGATFNPRAYNGGVTYANQAQGLVQLGGLPSGAEFPIGTTVNTFKMTDLAGNMSTCSFSVTVQEFPNPKPDLTCNDLINISVDEDCSTCIGADDVLEGGPYGCYDDYIVELDKTLPYGNGPWVSACVGSADIGKTYQVRVIDPETGNKCWGTVKIEDKIAPKLTCDPIVMPCNANVTPGAPINTYTAINNSIIDITAASATQAISPVVVSGITPTATVNDLNVEVEVTHTWVGDLQVDIESPNGTRITLMNNINNALACTQDNFKILFDDESSTPFAVLDDPTQSCNTSTTGNDVPGPPYAIEGDYQPQVALNTFDGQGVNGTWKVYVIDGFGADGGHIKSVKLSFGLTGAIVQPATVFEACCLESLTYTDSYVDEDCSTGLTRTISRKWTAKDCSGNTSTCVQKISLIRPTLGDVVMPADYDGVDAAAFQCTDNAYPTPDWIEGRGLQGYPWVFGEPEGCSIDWEYEDLRVDVCDGTYKIRRRWTVIDWCVGDGFTYNQIIKVMDNAAPTMACPANMTVSVDPFSCCAFVNLPDVVIEDNCSRINNISGMIVTFEPFTGEQTGMLTFGGSVTDFPGNNYWDLDTLGAFGWTPCLPQGTHTVTYVAEDDCGNTSTCSFRLTVRDYIPPVAACDETTTVAIGVDDPFDCYGPAGPNDAPNALGSCDFAGVTWVKATTFDDGSYDQCNGVDFTIRRQAPYSDCILGLNATNGQSSCSDIFPDVPSEFERAISEADSIKFYCCEVGTTQTIVLRVYQVDVNGVRMVGADGSPVFNECQIQVEVQDKIKPVCVSPANYTVTCEQFDPSLWLYGKATVSDNCCLDQTKNYLGQCGLTHTVSYTNFDTLCNKGTIVRTFRAFDCHGQSSQCTQRIVVNYEQDYFVRFPDDKIVSVCDGTGDYGEPTFYGEDCELLGVTYEDQIFTVVPDACYKIERSWKVINWCTYNPQGGCVNVPNPNPNAITNHPTNLPGPIVSPVQNAGDPWKSTIVKINPSDAAATNYSVYYNADANCYTYKQIIKIIDTQDPVAQCPASPVTICDITPNDPALWNKMYWWDLANSTHDLGDAPSDISLTASDACSGSNINFEYQLLLDLDGDGSMETVVNSTQLGSQPGGLGWNNVLYNNVNVTGGISRQFDDRPVAPNQKWGFALQETVSGNTKTASVKFNTQQAQNTYVTPQLPYGTHKIKWFITDGCGNEAICEYTIIIKDCKAPTVVCFNGLSVNIMPTGMITMNDVDFLEYTVDNYSQTQFLRTGIRKCGTGSGFPFDANGNPIRNVTFNCSEVGTQCVELWSIDIAGNADYCETYVIVQDNNGNCPNSDKINVSGALKTEDTNGVEEGNVTIAGTSSFTPPFSYFDLSDNAGVFSVNNSVPVASTMTITPVKDDNPLNGVTTYDLVLISKHILGIEPLNTPYKMIAADANKSNSITTFDIVELRKLILGIYTELPNNTSWRFIDKAQQFANPTNPFTAPLKENISVANALANMTTENFVGVKVGDVNGTAVANSAMVADDRTTGTLLFDVQDRDVKAGEVFDVTFKASDKAQGYQMTLNLNGLSVAGIVKSDAVNENNFGIFADALTVSVDGSETFTVTFKAEKAGKLSEMVGVSSRITKAEGYSLVDGRLDVALRFDGKTIAGVGFELYQNQPNPFVNKTFVGFHLPEAAAATLTVYDETGRVVFTQKGDFAKGYNAIALDRALLNTVGVLYYTLATENASATKKMIQTK